MTRTLVIAPQWIGDAVMSEPLLARLAARDEVLTVAALPWVAPVYRAMPQVAEVIELPFAHGRLDWSARCRLAATLRGRFEAAYVLPNSIKAALIPWLARIPNRIGYQGEGRLLLLNRRLPNPPGRPAMVAFYAALAGGITPIAERPALKFPDAALAAATHAAGVQPGCYWTFAPGAEYGPAKRWPYFRELAARLDGQVVLIGSLSDRKEAAQITGKNLVGQTTLDEAIDLIAGASLVVSNDSGLMHVAAASATRQVALFGSSSPEHTPPQSAVARVVWLKVDCSPCYQRICPLGHFKCMNGVSVERVLEEIKSLPDARR